MIFDGRKLTTLAMLALFSTASVLALWLPSKAAFLPLLVGIPGTLLCLAQLVIDFRDDRRDATTPSPPEVVSTDQPQNHEAKSEVEMMAWLGIFTVGLLCFGFVVGGPIVVFLYVRYCSRNTAWNSLISGAGTFAVLYGIFIWLLELSLFRGLILEAIF